MDEQTLIDIMGAKNYDLSIVTTKFGNQLNGQTVAWSTQTSIEPPLITIGIAKKHHTYSLIEKSQIFAINYMPQGNQNLLELFGYQSGRKIDKFINVEYEISNTGNPILKENAAFLDCELLKTYTTGDHELLIGKIIDADYKNLAWFQSKDFTSKAA